MSTTTLALPEHVARLYPIEAAGPLLRFDRGQLPDLDDLMLCCADCPTPAGPEWPMSGITALLIPSTSSGLPVMVGAEVNGRPVWVEEPSGLQDNAHATNDGDLVEYPEADR